MASQTRRLRKQQMRNEAAVRQIEAEGGYRTVVSVDGGVITYSDYTERELAALTELRTVPDVFGIKSRERTKP